MTIEDHEMGKEKLLTEKTSSGHKKPKFRRQESWRYKRVTDRWRRPHGIDSKMRKKIKGWPASPTTGYRSPKKIRGIHPSGFVETRVITVDDLIGIDPELQAIRIAHTVGGRKRVEILTRAEEKGIHVLNPRASRKSEAISESVEIKETESLSAGEK